jgi:hypothetical protein
MSKKVLLIAGVVLAAGSVAALSSPYFRGGQLRLGDMFAELGGGGDPDDRPRRSGKRHREMDADRDGPAVRRSGRRFDAANDEGGEDREGFTKSRRERSAMRDHDEEEGSQDLRGRLGRWFGGRSRDRQDGEEAESGPRQGRAGRDADGSRRSSAERQAGRGDRQFSRLDQNGDGVIDAKDFEAQAADLAASAARRFLKRYDTNGDGKVSREEFERVAKERPRERVADLELDGEDKMTEADQPPRQPGRGIVK